MEYISNRTGRRALLDPRAPSGRGAAALVFDACANAFEVRLGPAFSTGSPSNPDEVRGIYMSKATRNQPEVIVVRPTDLPTAVVAGPLMADQAGLS